MSILALVPMARVRSVPRSLEFYRRRGFVENGTNTPTEFRGEFQVTDPDRYVLMVTHT